MKPNCFENYKNIDKCIGLCHSENDDEPLEKCTNCIYFISYEDFMIETMEKWIDEKENLKVNNEVIKEKWML